MKESIQSSRWMVAVLYELSHNEFLEKAGVDHQTLGFLEPWD